MYIRFALMHGYEIRDKALELLVGWDPKRSADRALGLVAGLTKASGLALFRVTGSKLVLVSGRGIDQGGLVAAESLWAQKQGAHSRFEGDRERRRALLPLTSGGAGLIAALYLESDGRLEGPLDRIVTDVGPILVAAVSALGRRTGDNEVSTIDAFLEKTPIQEIEREKLLLLLERNEWNISRVARFLGVARVTVYQKLEKHGITRQRVPKTVPRPIED